MNRAILFLPLLAWIYGFLGLLTSEYDLFWGLSFFSVFLVIPMWCIGYSEEESRIKEEKTQRIIEEGS